MGVDAAPREPRNPFGVTKAVDFSDDEIARMFVDLPTEGGWEGVIRPREAMPMLLLGGKGAGRTHLMRYFSLAVRSLEGAVLDRVRSDGFLGIYVRASGLNANRFAGRDEPPHRWEPIISYYMDLWLAQTVIEATDLVLRDDPQRDSYERALVEEILSLLDEPPESSAATLAEARSIFHELQREVDVVVNNLQLSTELNDLTVRSTRGRLVFGIPQAIARHAPCVGDVQFLYLLDEFENLAVDPQRYVNTLLRERESPSSFRVGARTYAVKTYSTYSGDEENREGSEYEAIYLDEIYIDQQTLFANFCRDVAARRLQEESRLPLPRGVAAASLDRQVDELFEVFPQTAHHDGEMGFLEDVEPARRAHLRRMRRRLRDARIAANVTDEIVELLRVPEHPLLEKTNTFLFYQRWNDSSDDLLESARQVEQACAAYLAGGRGSYGRTLGHFSADLIAQMLDEVGEPQRYLGFGSYITLSAGLPRNLMTLLKHVYLWAVFNGEEPFAAPLSIRAQQAGVVEASRWFFDNARVLGERGFEVHECIRRLGSFFRAMRFSDKPIESSCATFSVDRSRITEHARENLHFAQQSSLLLSVRGGQKNRNVRRLDAKYQLSPMLAPIWDLPTARRGAVPLGPEEANAIFDPAAADQFDELVNERMRRMNAPFPRSNGPAKTSPPQDQLFEP